MYKKTNKKSVYLTNRKSMVYKIFLFIILILFLRSLKYINIFPANIPELMYYNNQNLKIIVPSKKCYFCHKTLYFNSNLRNNNLNENLKINTISLNKYQKNYFVTYYINNYNYYVYYNLLKKHGLFRSQSNFGNHNFIIDDELYNNLNITDKINNINKYSKIYQYINGNYLFKKDILYKNYNSMKKNFDEDFNYMPETFYYPEDKKIIETKFNNYSLDIDNLWLVKPTNKYGGKGIFIFNSLKEIKIKEFIITKYIMNLDLIKNKKYDLRLYVLISGLKPLRIYLNKQGLIRIASEKFSLNINTIGNKFIHLTNTDINKKNKNYIYPKSFNDSNANVWNLNTYKKYLNQNNKDWNYIYENIKDIIIKTIISVQQKLINKNDNLNLRDNNFYNLLGFDILINDKFEPILLEVNYSPCMNIYNKVDIFIKTNLFVDILNIVGIIPFSKKNFKTFDKEYKFKNKINESINNAFCELNRPRGDLELIFPLKDNINKYKKYFNNISDENEIFWKILYKNN